MRVRLNGDWRVIDEPSHVEQLVADLGLPAAAVLVEHNGLALRRTEWAERDLQDGDQLEIIRIVAGG